MAAIVSLFVVLVLSILVVRVASVALTMTGLSRELARFQARSAFSGAGFTTGESEKVVGHPVRRRIIMTLIPLGDAGIVTAVSSLVLSFANLEGAEGWSGSIWFGIPLLSAGLSVLWTLAHSEWLDRKTRALIEWALNRWTRLDVTGCAGLLRLSGDYGVSEFHVSGDHWMAGQTLAEINLFDEGIIVLGIERGGGRCLGTPRGPTRVEPDDSLILYGRRENLDRLKLRKKGFGGFAEHVKAIEEQKEIEKTES